MPVWSNETGGMKLPRDAFKAGRDKNNAIIYVGKAHHKNDILPAKVVAGHTDAYASYGGAMVPKEKFEVLCGYAYFWEPFIRDMPKPKHAVIAGKTADKEDLFVARVVHEGCDVIGKVHRNRNECFFPAFDKTEKRCSEFEILIEVPCKEEVEYNTENNHL